MNEDKLRFALVYHKNGRNASAAAREMDMPRNKAYRLTKDAEVKACLKVIAESLDGAEPERADIADMDEVLAAWSAIVRDEHKIEKLAAKKKTTTESEGRQKNVVTEETPEVVQLNAANSDIISAGKAIYQYWRDIESEGGDAAETGVIILAEIKEDQEGG